MAPFASLLGTARFIVNHPLNRRSPARALGRFVRWQVRSRLVEGPTVHEWVNGARFIVRRGETGLTGNLYAGLCEFEEMGFVLHFLRADDLFVDVGANAGAYTILAGGAIGARGIAFEPAPSTYARLVENVRLNALEARVHCDNRAVGARPGRIAFTTDRDTTNRVLVAEERYPSSAEVEVTTLDEALDGAAPSLLKIDVEGYEPAVLEGARETLRKPELRAAIVELNGAGTRYGFDEAGILAELFALGFRMCSYDPVTRTLALDERRSPGVGNGLFIRDEEFVRRRVSTAPKVRINGFTL